MPLTLEQYADYLDTRDDLHWPAPPEFKHAKARPFLERLPDVRVVTWGVYGTLLAIAEKELHFVHPNAFIMDLALDKTIQEFKMWKAMTRKPGKPSEYMRLLYTNALDELRMLPAAGEKHPEIQVEKIWEMIVNKLLQNEYEFDGAFFGFVAEYSRKIAYFFHASMQGTACYGGAAEALRAVASAGLSQGLLGDGQTFTCVQLHRGLRGQDARLELNALIPTTRRVLSAEVRARRPSERLFKEMLNRLAKEDISPGEVLHVGNTLERDVAPAKRLGMRTALFAGDKRSVEASAEQMKQPNLRPDVLLTELPQIANVVG
jgi:hypothetical protein